MSTQQFNRRSIRLPGGDYSKAGYYFVTICSRERECVLGKIVELSMRKNEMGEMVEKTWRELPHYFSDIMIDRFVIMPNHLHGIIQIKENKRSDGTVKKRGLMNQTPTPKPQGEQWIMMKNPSATLGKIIRYFKAKSAFTIRKQMNNSFSWQRNYFGRVIRDRRELIQIRYYIENNPSNWSLDEDNPIARKT